MSPPSEADSGWQEIVVEDRYAALEKARVQPTPVVEDRIPNENPPDDSFIEEAEAVIPEDDAVLDNELADDTAIRDVESEVLSEIDQLTAAITKQLSEPVFPPHDDLLVGDITAGS